MTRTVHTTEEMQALAAETVATVTRAPRSGARVLALYGDLGAGKTTFTQGIARALGIEETIISPTFIIERAYKIPKGAPFAHLVHIDCYRFESPDEARHLGWDRLIADADALIVVEWAERIEALLPADAVKLRFEYEGEGARRVIFEDQT